MPLDVDISCMTWDLLKACLPYLAVLIYLLITAVLSVLAARHREAIARYDQERQAKLQHLDRLKELHRRKSAVMRNSAQIWANANKK